LTEETMPLTFASPPPDGLVQLSQGLQSIRQAQALDPRGGSSALTLPASPHAMQPHPVYELGLDDLAAGKGLESVRLVAWRYLLVDNQQVRQAAEILPASGGGTRFGMLTTGFVAGAEPAFSLAEQLPDVQQRNYEIRSLRVPALYVMALWLKDTQGDQDRFILLPPVFPPLQPLRPYEVPELLPILQHQAARKAPLEQQVTPP
jgi:hypothetical protein